MTAGAPGDGTVDVYVAAGSNIDPIARLQQALTLMKARFGPLQVSTAYRNRAVGFEGPDFVNLAVGLRTRESVEEVRAGLQEIEERCGRPRSAPKWASRAMDLDILLYGDVTRDTADLRLPRHDLLVRPYMLGPLAEIAPDVRHPGSGRTIRELWAAFDKSSHSMTPIALPAAGR
jgi:2-amino-4-hydroxy-6-hydroxymethyldihydropteridine diphosphokinase